MAALEDKTPKEIGRALLKALKEDNMDAVQYFLTAPDVDVKCFVDADLYTALHFAAAKNLAEVARSIVEKGANINAQDKEGCTPLHYVAKKGSEEIVKMLLEKGAASNIKATRYFHTALHFAALMGHASIVKMLLEKYADPSVEDKDGCTPLHYAAKNGRLEVVRVLLEKAQGDGGESANARTKNAYTPLHFAVVKGYKDVTELLLENGAESNATDDRNYTVLHYAAKKGEVEIVRLLLLKGADVSSTGKDGKRPQDLTRNPEILADLQSFGAAIEGFTPPEGYKPLEAPFTERQTKIKEFSPFEKYFN